MKILHINSYYSGSNFYKNLYDNQIKSGLEIDVFVPVTTSYKKKENLGIYTKLSENHTKLDRFLFHLKHYKIHKDIVNKYDISNYSIIHAHSLFSNGYIAFKLKKKFNIPYIVAVRNTDINIFFKKMIHLRKLGIQILENADQIIFLSQSYRNEIINKYIPKESKKRILAKTVIIPNGVDNYWLEHEGNMKCLTDKDNVKLLYVGVVNKNKNIIATANAIKLLSNKNIKAKLQVVGSIKDQSVYKQINSLDCIEYIEPKSKKELVDIYRQNDIFVMPSIHESFGLVYVEAMSQGLPVIYSRNQGFDQQFEEGEVGYSVLPTDSDEISSKIIKILNNLDGFSRRSIENSKQFNWSEISEKYKKIYFILTS